MSILVAAIQADVIIFPNDGSVSDGSGGFGYNGVGGRNDVARVSDADGEGLIGYRPTTDLGYAQRPALGTFTSLSFDYYIQSGSLGGGPRAIISLFDSTNTIHEGFAYNDNTYTWDQPLQTWTGSGNIFNNSATWRYVSDDTLTIQDGLTGAQLLSMHGDQNVSYFGFINDSGSSEIYTSNWAAAAVPEPATLAGLGLGALALIRRRRKA